MQFVQKYITSLTKSRTKVFTGSYTRKTNTHGHLTKRYTCHLMITVIEPRAGCRHFEKEGCQPRFLREKGGRILFLFFFCQFHTWIWENFIKKGMPTPAPLWVRQWNQQLHHGLELWLQYNCYLMITVIAPTAPSWT